MSSDASRIKKNIVIHAIEQKENIQNLNRFAEQTGHNSMKQPVIDIKVDKHVICFSITFFFCYVVLFFLQFIRYLLSFISMQNTKKISSTN